MENSKIEWTDLLRITAMKFFVTILAKGLPVTCIESKFGIIGKWLNVVSYQIPAFFVATLLAGKLVSGKDIKAPTLILSREALTSPFGQLAILVGVMNRSTYSRAAFSFGLTHLDSRFYAVFDTKSGLFSPVGLTKFLLSFFCVVFVLKGGRTAFGGLANLDSRTILALSLQPIPSAFVGIEPRRRFPDFTLVTPLQPIGKFAFVLFEGNPDTLGSNLDSAFFCLSHCENSYIES